MFEKFGKIVEIVIKGRRDPYAFVEFEEEKAAEEALEKYESFFVALFEDIKLLKYIKAFA